MRGFVHFLAVLALLFTLAPVSAQTDETVDRAIEYIKTQQQDDGSFAGVGAGSTADAIFALAAAGEDVDAVQANGTSAIDFINSQTEEAQQDAGLAAKYAIALLLAGQSTTLEDGTDLLEIVESSYDDQTGQYGADTTAHAYALIALATAGRDVPAEAVDALEQLQQEDGGWSFNAESGSDTNTTALAVQALVAAGDDGDVISQAVEYYRTQQNDDGGFPYSQESEYGTDSDANSTALSIQALLAAGENLDDWAKDGSTPVDRLVEFQNESGAFRYQDAMADDNAFATYQAVPAVVGETLPRAEGAVTEQPAATPEAAPEATAETTSEAAPEATADASPEPTTSPRPQEQSLPDTGLIDTVPVYAFALVAMLLLSGLLLRRRRA